MSRINHLITDSGASISVASYGLDHNDFGAAVQALRQFRAEQAEAVKIVAVNLYNAATAPFCLGSHLHSDIATARAKATAENYFSTFLMKYDSRNRSVALANAPGSTPAQRRYALFTGSKFRKPAYASADEAYRNRESNSDMVVEIGVYGTAVVSLRVV